MAYELFEVTQGAIIKNKDGAVLILEGEDGKCLLPGGHVDRGENWIDALHRELREEIGLENFTVKKIVDIAAAPLRSRANSIYIMTFLIEPIDFKEPILSGEHAKYQWMMPKDFERHTFWHDSIKERIRKGLADESLSS